MGSQRVRHDWVTFHFHFTGSKGTWLRFFFLLLSLYSVPVVFILSIPLPIHSLPCAPKNSLVRWFLGCCRSVARSCLTLCCTTDCSMPGFPVLHYLPEFAQSHILWVSDTIQPSHPWLSPSPPIFSLSQHQSLSNKLVLHIRWPNYWILSFSISPSNEYSGLISFRIDWFDLLAVQGTLKSLLQHHDTKRSIFWHSGKNTGLCCHFLLQGSSWL